MISVWRICHNGDLTLAGLPYGSTLGPGRWHLPPPGGPGVVYAAASRALAQLEKRVHANGVAPIRQALLRLTLPTGCIIQDARTDLALASPRWRSDEGYTQALGVQWHGPAPRGRPSLQPPGMAWERSLTLTREAKEWPASQNSVGAGAPTQTQRLPRPRDPRSTASGSRKMQPGHQKN